MFRRALGSLLTLRRFSPCAFQAPSSAPLSPRSIQRDLALNATVFAVAALAGAGGAMVVQSFKKATGAAESADKVIAAIKEVTYYKVIDFNKPDMKVRFERWIVKNNKAYRDEEEKVMRFQLFKATVEWIESHPRSVQEGYFPEVSYFADFTEQERRCMLAYPDALDRTNEYNEMIKDACLGQARERYLLLQFVYL